MKIIIAILLAIIVVLLLLFVKFQRQMKDICRQLKFLRENDSNMMITQDISFGGIGKLTDALNEFLEYNRKKGKEYRRMEKTISDTYSNLSHDIRTPLTSLDGYFQLLENTDDEEKQKRYVHIIQERISSLKDMLEELFTFTKLQNESYHLSLERCEMNRILKETLLSYYDEWVRRGITPELSITEKSLYFQGNDLGIRRVIQNIIKNGMEHGEKKIEVTLFDEKGRIILMIRNQVSNSQEIDPRQVFERFYKADTTRSKNSTGLGLSIAKEFVNRMDGTIAARLVDDWFEIRVELPISKGVA